MAQKERISREHLMFKALCALREAQHKAEQAPFQPDRGLRFALAYLWSQARPGSDRTAFDDFWLALSSKGAGVSDHVRQLERIGQLTRALNGIFLAVGYPSTPDATGALDRALRRLPPLDPRMKR